MLITTSELEKTLDNPNLILIDTRSFQEYSQGHILNALNLDLFSFHWIDTSKEGILSFNQQLEKIFSSVGVTEEKEVIFYDNVSGMLAARGVWLLEYLSHTHVSMLDGGMTKWKNEGRTWNTIPVNNKPTNFSGTPNPKILAGFQYVFDNLNKVTILDVRSKEEFSGDLVRAARGGHIPTAINIAGALLSVAYAFGITIVILKIMDAVWPGGIRVTPKEEEIGMDLAQNGERAYVNE